jgi:hypothetical protein
MFEPFPEIRSFLAVVFRTIFSALSEEGARDIYKAGRPLDGNSQTCKTASSLKPGASLFPVSSHTYGRND